MKEGGPYKALLVNYWLEKGEDALQSAILELQGGHGTAAVNRCYYACLYAFYAVLTHDARKLKKHTAVQASLNRDYVKPGIMPIALGDLYNELFINRQEGDYTFTDFKPNTVHRWIDSVRHFIDWCRKYVGMAEDDGK